MISPEQHLPAQVREIVDDPSRREVLAALQQVTHEQDKDFDRVSRLAAVIFDAPRALVTLVDSDRMQVVSGHGPVVDGATECIEFCSRVLAQPYGEGLVQAAGPDDRPASAIADDAGLMAGAAIRVRGQPVGALCVQAPRARDKPTETQLAQLQDLASMAGSLFELKEEARVRDRTAAELIKEEWRHALTLEAGKVGSWVWDKRTGEVTVNDMLRAMFALGPTGPVNIEQLFAAIHPEDRPTVERALGAAFDTGVDYAAEYRIALTGRWLIARGRVYQRDAAGNPLVMMGVNIDVTETREAAEQTRRLLRELNHRVKNTLAMIQALARQTLRQSTDPQRFIDAFSGRLRTLSEAHVLLSDRDWSGIGLIELIRTQVAPYLDVPERLELEGQDLKLPPDHALGLGVILNELASNAAHHGALSGHAGTVTISWQRAGAPEPRVDLMWKEQGGPPVVVSQKGLGTRLIERSLDKVLESQVSLRFPVEGVEAHISFPLPREA